MSAQYVNSEFTVHNSKICLPKRETRTHKTPSPNALNGYIEGLKKIGEDDILMKHDLLVFVQRRVL